MSEFSSKIPQRQIAVFILAAVIIIVLSIMTIGLNNVLLIISTEEIWKMWTIDLSGMHSKHFKADDYLHNVWSETQKTHLK